MSASGKLNFLSDYLRCVGSSDQSRQWNYLDPHGIKRRVQRVLETAAICNFGGGSVLVGQTALAIILALESAKLLMEVLGYSPAVLSLWFSEIQLGEKTKTSGEMVVVKLP